MTLTITIPRAVLVALGVLLIAGLIVGAFFLGTAVNDGGGDRATAGASERGAGPTRSETTPGARLPEITEVVLATGRTSDFQPVGASFTFNADQKEIFAIVTIENVNRAVQLNGVWTYLGRTGQASPVKKAERGVSIQPIERTTRKAALSYVTDALFDEGIYKVEVQLDGKTVKTLEFTVVFPGSRAPPTRPAPPAEPAQGAPARPQGVAPVTGASPGTYVVRPGDTFSSLAAAWGVSVDAIASYNGLDPRSVLPAGVLLHIPPGGFVASAPPAAPAQTSSGPPPPPPTRTPTPTPLPTSTPTVTPTPPPPAGGPPFSESGAVPTPGTPNPLPNPDR